MGIFADLKHMRARARRFVSMVLLLPLAACIPKRGPHVATPSYLSSCGCEADLFEHVGDRVFFNFDSSVLSSDLDAILTRQSAWLAKYPSVNVLVAGNADERGTETYTDPESRQTIISGVDELHLASKLDYLRRLHSLDINVGKFHVAYRESVGRRSEITYTHKKHLGPTGQYACVKIIFEPGEPDSCFLFENKIADGSVPKEFVHGVERGLALAKQNGWLAGFPVIQLKATLIGGGYHDVDSSILAFEIAARGAFFELRDKGDPKLLEPIMEVEICTSDDRLDAILADLSQKRRQIKAAEIKSEGQMVTALVPFADMLGYASVLRDLTGDSARFTMRYHSYMERLLPEPPDDVFGGSGRWAMGGVSVACKQSSRVN